MKIALIGATGFVGSAVLKEAASRGNKVKAVVRNAANVEMLDGVTAVKADVTDVPALKAAIADADVVISAFNGGWGDPDIYAKHSAGSKAIVEAAKAAGKRVIVVGGAGSLEIDGRQLVDGPDFPAAYKDGARAARDALKALHGETGMEWSFISPAIMMAPGERTGKFRLGGDQPVFDASGQSHISVEDLAVAIVDEAESPRHTGMRFTIGY
ncbi:NAD(P)-dependent oxidoreductase [Mesorhizobium sp. ANAO-SY3R2]|uniref:NAD(P)-dependent oxidoreductase n=1 Tax=Mesorhizobium sp. ANAO-SY3R2 TaxID=3166644 RepID=UPI00366EFAE9